MRKFICPVLAACAAVFAVSCAEDRIAFDNSAAQTGFVEMTFDITGDITRSSLTEDLKVNFENGDSVAVYAVLESSVSEVSKFTVESASGTSAVIRGTVPGGALSYVAVYPFDAAVSYKLSNATATDTLTFNVASAQYIPEGKNFDPRALVSYAKAVAGQPLALRNAVSLLKFTVSSSDVQSVGIGTGTDLIAGEQMIFMASGDVATDGAASVIVRPDATSGTTLAAGTYYASILPVEASSGFAVVTGKTSGVDYKMSDKGAGIERNAVLNLGTVDGKAFPTTITSKDELLAFAKCASCFSTSQEIRLGADIDLECAAWPNPEFHGIFDGQNHRVYNFVTKNNIDFENVGFFSQLGDGTDGATLKNLCVGSKDYNFETKTGSYDGVSTITFSSKTEISTYKYAGLVAYVHFGSTVDNVVNFANVTVAADAVCRHRTGGVCGTMKNSTTVRDCINFGTLTDNSEKFIETTALAIGGVIGTVDGGNGTCKVYDCINYGDIVSNAAQVTLLGGVAGYAYGDTMSNCKNYGKITHNGNVSGTVYSGGVVGQIKSAIEITNCENHGDVVFNLDSSTSVTTAMEAGGIAGYCNTLSSIVSCSNSGDITFGNGITTNASSTIELGGILARNVSNAATIRDCSNTGKIQNGLSSNMTSSEPASSGICIGGIIGRSHQGTVLANCSCTADITNEGCSVCTKVGGIIGYTQSTPSFSNCVYTGKITANEPAGGAESAYSGFAGWTNKNYVAPDGLSVDATVELKSVPAMTYTGGLVGYIKCTKAATFKNTSVRCSVTGADAAYSGILVGKFDSTKILTIGTADSDPVRVCGSFNGIALTADNYTDYLKGTSSTSAKLVINPVFKAE